MSYLQIQALRNQAAHFLSYEVARSAGMPSLASLEQFVAGTFHPSQDQLVKLANRIGWPK